MSGAPPDVVLTQDQTGTTYHSLPASNSAGTSDSVALPFQGVTGGVPVPVSGTFWQATQAVSGTFWQATQPVSGTFWQTTQPVSGTVGVSGNVSVTGTFWPTTQPVSGTFWQATQPVSGGGQGVSPWITNPSSTLTLPSTTTLYAANTLVANSGTAGSVVNPSFVIANSGGGAQINRLRLFTNDTTSTSWGSVALQVDLWTAAPTWTNGDRGAWKPATGSANHLASFTGIMSSIWGDGACCELTLAGGASEATVALASGATIYWSIQVITATGVTGASKVFTLIPEIVN